MILDGAFAQALSPMLREALERAKDGQRLRGGVCPHDTPTGPGTAGLTDTLTAWEARPDGGPAGTPGQSAGARPC